MDRMSIRGANCCTAKLTEEQALECLLSSERASVLARRLSVDKTTVLKIRNRTRWRHLQVPEQHQSSKGQ